MIDLKILGQMKKDLKKQHLDLMEKLDPLQRAKFQAKLNMEIDKVKANNDNSIINDFMKEIYNR